MKKITYPKKHLLLAMSLLASVVFTLPSHSSDADPAPSPYLSQNILEDLYKQLAAENKKPEEASEELLKSLGQLSSGSVQLSRVAFSLLMQGKTDDFRDLLGGKLSEQLKDDQALENLFNTVKKDMGDGDSGSVVVLKVLKANEETKEAAALEVNYYHIMLKESDDEKAQAYTYLTKVSIPLKVVPSVESTKEIEKIFSADSLELKEVKITSSERLIGIPEDLRKALEKSQKSAPKQELKKPSPGKRQAELTA